MIFLAATATSPHIGRMVDRRSYCYPNHISDGMAEGELRCHASLVGEAARGSLALSRPGPARLARPNSVFWGYPQNCHQGRLVLAVAFAPPLAAAVTLAWRPVLSMAPRILARAMMAQLRLAPVRLASSRLAPMRLALVRSEARRSEPCKLALLRLARRS